MFDSTSDKWISSLELVIRLMFWGEIIAGIIFGIMDSTDWYIIGEGWAFFFWSVVGFVVAYLNLIGGMLLVNYLDNVQIIRMAVEDLRTRKPAVEQETKSIQPVVESDGPGSVKNQGMISVEIGKLRRLKEQGEITEEEFLKRAAQFQK